MTAHFAHRYEVLDVVNLYATLKRDVWTTLLIRAIRSGNTEKLTGYRYGLQAGLTLAVKNKLTTQEMEVWVIRRIREVEKAMKIVLRRKHPNPLDNPKHNLGLDKKGLMMKALAAKRARDKDFEIFLRRSAF